MASLLRKLSCIDQKYEKWKPNEHFGGGLYMFIYTNEIGHLTSCWLCMT